MSPAPDQTEQATLRPGVPAASPLTAEQQAHLDAARARIQAAAAPAPTFVDVPPGMLPPGLAPRGIVSSPEQHAEAVIAQLTESVTNGPDLPTADDVRGILGGPSPEEVLIDLAELAAQDEGVYYVGAGDTVTTTEPPEDAPWPYGGPWVGADAAPEKPRPAAPGVGVDGPSTVDPTLPHAASGTRAIDKLRRSLARFETLAAYGGQRLEILERLIDLDARIDAEARASHTDGMSFPDIMEALSTQVEPTKREWALPSSDQVYQRTRLARPPKRPYGPAQRTPKPKASSGVETPPARKRRTRAKADGPAEGPPQGSLLGG